MAEESITIDNKKILTKQKNHEYYLKNKDRILKRQCEYDIRNKYKIKKYQIEYSQRTRNNTRRQKYRRELLKLLGNKCIKCGFSDSRALQFDHINDDGHADRKLLKSADGILCYYYKNPEIAKQKLQILCANCNWIKRFEINKHNQHNR